MPRVLVNNYKKMILASTPVGYWRMNDASGNATDSSGNGLTLTANGGITYAQTGALVGSSDTAVKLNGTTGFFSSTDSAFALTSSFTLELWFKRADAVLTTYGLMSKGALPSGNTNSSYVLFLDGNGKLQMRLSADGAAQAASVTSTQVINDTANWHHGMVVYDAVRGYLYLYVDGLQAVAPTSTAPTALFNTSATFRVGADCNNSNVAIQEFNGSIDEVAVYNHIFGGNHAAIAAQHYAAGLVGNTASSLAGARTLAGTRSLVTSVMTRRISGDPIITDTFTRANSSSSLGSTESPTLTWTTTGTWGITTNTGASKAAGAQTAIIDSGVSDCAIEVTCKRVSSVIGLLGRSILRFSSAGSTTYTVARNDTSATLATFTGPSWSANQVKTLKMVMLGSNIYCFVDGGLIGTLSSSLNQTNTSHGLFANSASDASLFTNFHTY